MSSITTTQASYLSVPDIAPSYVLDQRPTDQLFEVLPFKPIAGHELSLSTVDASSQGLSALADAEAAGAAIVSTMPTITERTFALKRISAEMPVDSMIPGLYGGHRDIVQALLQIKVNAVRDHFKLLLVQGDSNAAAEEFDGLKRLATVYSQAFGANSTATDGGTVQKGELEELLNMLNPRPRTSNVYLVMHAKARKTCTGWRHGSFRRPRLLTVTLRRAAGARFERTTGNSN